jgi:enoyl-CoA hydratase/carnithine racemase
VIETRVIWRLVAVITVNNPEQRNPLGDTSARKLAEVLGLISAPLIACEPSY